MELAIKPQLSISFVVVVVAVVLYLTFVFVVYSSILRCTDRNQASLDSVHFASFFLYVEVVADPERYS